MWGTDTSCIWKSPNEQSIKVFDIPFEVPPERMEEYFSSPIKQVICGSNNTAFLLENGQCFVMGENKSGNLGVGHKEVVSQPTEIKLNSNVPSVAQVSLGPNFSAFVDTEGYLYTCGFGGSAMQGMGWLGHGDAETLFEPKRVESLVEDGCEVQQVEVGELHMVVLTTEGEVLTTGAGSYGRLGNLQSADSLTLDAVEVLTISSQVTSIKSGKSFTLALTKDGVLYSWGRNHKGQLGTGLGLSVDIYAMQDYPEPIEADELLGRRVIKMAAGHSHAACITESGELFYWGMSLHFDPVRVNELLHTKIVDVQCGEDYTLAVDADGKLYSFGTATTGIAGGNSGVLGQGSKSSRLNQATHMEAFQSLSIQQLSAGWKHAACLVKDKE